MIRLTTGKPSEGMSYETSDCPPPGVNGAASVVAHPVEPGQGVGSLTIDRKNFSRLYFDSCRRNQASRDVLWRMAVAAAGRLRHGGPVAVEEHDALCTGITYLDDRIRVQVEHVREYGGLLHLVP